jgi:hypothetical protein
MMAFGEDVAAVVDKVGANSIHRSLHLDMFPAY